MSTKAQSQKSTERVILRIPSFDTFADQLHDRLHEDFKYIEDWNNLFMLITVLYDRDSVRVAAREIQNSQDIESLVYTGINRQRQLLEENDPIFYISDSINFNKEEWRAQRNINWNNLRNKEINRSTEDGALAFDFFDDYRSDKTNIDDVRVGTLKEYFKLYSENEFKKNEKPIVQDYFDINEDLYIGIPILGFKKFQGIAWVIFKKEDEHRFDIDRKKRIIKLFEKAYRELVLNWEIPQKLHLINDMIQEPDEDNPLVSELKIGRLEKSWQFYLKARQKEHQKVIGEIRTQYIRTATISILLDSFAHNISAHSLTALSWWFRERSEYLGEGKEMLEALGRDLNPLIKHYKMRQDEKQQLVKAIRYLLDEMGNKTADTFKVELLSVLNEWDDNYVPQKNENTLIEKKKRQRRPTLSRELYPLFKFLLEKGAFWSGIARQTNFTGKVSSLYNVLWHDFVNNPLYLGTIANTEEVLKLHIRVTIYEGERSSLSGSAFRNIKKVKTINGVALDGVFATINLLDFKMAKDARSSLFVEEGPLFEALSMVLQQIKVFFPGGVIGKHAFFTLLENEVRNVKHFHGEDLKRIQQEGLTLAVSIHELPFDVEHRVSGEDPQLLKFGVWLHHPIDLTAERLVKRIKNLDTDIIDETTSRPRLGGNFQDKICASMLLTNSFNRVQDNESPVGQIYYPWIKTAGCPVPSDNMTLEFEEFEVSHRRYRKISDAEFNNEFAVVAGPSYLKKYFHLWKGADILSVDPVHTTMAPADAENQGRYRFMFLKNADMQAYKEYKAKGIVRLLAGTETPASVPDAYHLWLEKWMKREEGSTNMVVMFTTGSDGKKPTNQARLTYIDGVAGFENKVTMNDNDAMDKRFETLQKQVPEANTMRINISHGSQLNKSPENLNYRTDGELIRHFCGGLHPSEAQISDQDYLFELIETFATRICVFDHRVYNRLYSGDSSLQGIEDTNIGAQKLEVQRKRLEAYRKHLLLDVRSETEDSWAAVQASDFLKYHFLIVHLSFMESMKDADGNEYREERIIEFIDDQILKGRAASEVEDDFMLVITTGRGREKWWETVKENPEYARFTTFRPIESILGAIEDAMQVADDFNLKYNLAKLLFGS